MWPISNKRILIRFHFKNLKIISVDYLEVSVLLWAEVIGDKWSLSIPNPQYGRDLPQVGWPICVCGQRLIWEHLTWGKANRKLSFSVRHAGLPGVSSPGSVLGWPADLFLCEGARLPGATTLCKCCWSLSRQQGRARLQGTRKALVAEGAGKLLPLDHTNTSPEILLGKKCKWSFANLNLPRPSWRGKSMGLGAG